MSLIEMKNLIKRYGKGDTAFNAVDDVSFSIKNGEFVAIMGPSGSGKSTIMNITGCLDVPSSGNYLFKGEDAGNLSRDQLALIRRHYIGFVFQGFNLLKRTSAIENLELPLIYRGTPKKERREKAMEALETVGLADRAKHTPSELSGGEQQRIAIARTLVTSPPLMLADEPTGNLDTARSHEIMELLTRLNEERGITIVMVTHEDEMAEYAKRLIHFRDGKIEKEDIRK